MNTLDCIKTRRSIRKYLNTKINKDIVLKILEYGMQSPSACDSRPWEFVVVDDENLLEKLNINSPLSIFICGKTDIDNPFKPFLNETWIQDCSAVAQNILLVCNELGLGACWRILHPLEKIFEYRQYISTIKETLNLPYNISLLCHIDIGYSDEEKENINPKDKFDLKKIHWNTHE